MKNNSKKREQNVQRPCGRRSRIDLKNILPQLEHVVVLRHQAREIRRSRINSVIFLENDSRPLRIFSREIADIFPFSEDLSSCIVENELRGKDVDKMTKESPWKMSRSLRFPFQQLKFGSLSYYIQYNTILYMVYYIWHIW